MRKVVYVLLVSRETGDSVQVGLGPICWTQIDAAAARRALEGPGVRIQMVEREIRGEMPEMKTLGTGMSNVQAGQ